MDVHKCEYMYEDALVQNQEHLQSGKLLSC